MESILRKFAWKKNPENSIFVRILNLSSCLFFLTGFFIHCSKPFPESPLLDLVLLQSIQKELRVSDTNAEGIANTRKYIFVSQGTYQGSLGGVSGADTICQNEKTNNFASLPGANSDYKAILVDGSNRIACVAGNCNTAAGNNSNWPLIANTQYFRPDNQVIFQTNGAGIFVLGALSNAFSNSGTDRWWTGLVTNWTSSTDDCANWISNGGAVFGIFGLGGATDDSSISDFSSDACSTSKKLLCVRN
ncbi:MAG: DUF1554 domain-containing protein [Leptospiraceae bacterium]|nr:DUF1554 domain-containing protein [Leptospiraceae bacterium]